RNGVSGASARTHARPGTAWRMPRGGSVWVASGGADCAVCVGEAEGLTAASSKHARGLPTQWCYRSIRHIQLVSTIELFHATVRRGDAATPGVVSRGADQVRKAISAGREAEGFRR